MDKKNIAKVFTIAILFWACNNTNNPTQAISTPEAKKTNPVPLVPINGEIRIGNQTWASTNLNVSNFRNGDRITEVKTEEAWQKAGFDKKPAWCYYLNDSTNEKKYGKLYNWYAVNDKRGLSPAGWHIPSDNEWAQLINFLGSESVAGAKLKSTNGWKDKGNGTNITGFSALPGGYRFLNGVFNANEYFGSWWSATESYTNSAFFRSIRYDDNGVYRSNYGKEVGFSVRCIKD